MAANPLVCTFHEATIYQSDLDALDAPHWLNDSLITFYLQHLQHCAFISDNQTNSAGTPGSPAGSDESNGLLFLTPGAVFVLAHEDDADDFASTLAGLDIARHALVFLPINDNANVERGGGGSHWSLLVLDVSALAFAHYDSAGRVNLAVARALATKLHAALKASSGKHSGPLRLSSPACPTQVYGCAKLAISYSRMPIHSGLLTHQTFLCSRWRQTNGWDCGLHVLCAAEAVARAWLARRSLDVDWSALPPTAIAAHRATIRRLIEAQRRSSSSE